ncbi:hypothetical protein OAA06_01010 [bacterium]|nr:hypothetical protein [bacterium]
MKRIVLDESVSQRQFLKVIDYLGYDNSSLPEIVDIKETYPGIPDNEILKHLLNDHSIFITADRVVHNKTLLQRKKSVYIDRDFVITETVLKGIVLPVKKTNGKLTELKSNYEIEKADIHEKLLPENEKQLKKLRTKRRRIRNHFDGLDNISNIDISVSKKENKNKILIGIKIRVVSNNGIKSLDASEVYIVEDKSQDAKILICYVLITLLRLLLNSKTITIYYDQNEIRGDFDSKSDTEFSELYIILMSYFDQLTINPVRKGRNIEMVRRKLCQLNKNDPGNEIVTGDIAIIKQRINT